MRAPIVYPRVVGNLLQNAALYAEFLVLFVLLPLSYRFSPVRIPALPLLWIVAGYALWRLLADSAFDRARLWNTPAFPAHAFAIFALFAAAALLLWLAVHFLAPHLEWGFVRRHPAFWVIVMVAYPALSVYPQGLIYRAYFFERFGPIFPAPWMATLASAAAFAFLHIIFRNSLAVWLTFLGGLLFAWRYQLTGSLFASSLEHALYGCWLFTIGLGAYFYHGTIATLQAAAPNLPGR